MLKYCMRVIFSEAANKNASLNSLIDNIIAARPDLSAATFYVPEQGKNSLTVMTEDEVFKAPTQAEHAAYFVKEYNFLSHMNGCDLGLATPVVTLPITERGFYGMTRLQGAPLTRDMLDSLPEQEQRAIADSLARFNARFATALTDGDRQYLSLTRRENYQPITPDETLSHVAQPHMKQALGADHPAAQRLAATHARRFNETAEKERVVMIHSDLHPGNILYDRTTKKLGVIDLGAGRVIPVDMGLSPLHHAYSASWVDRFLSAFSRESGIKVTEEQILAKKCLYGLRHLAQNPGDEKSAAFVKSQLQEWAKTDSRAPQITPQHKKSL